MVRLVFLATTKARNTDESRIAVFFFPYRRDPYFMKFVVDARVVYTHLFTLRKVSVLYIEDSIRSSREDDDKL